ncbi:MAG: zinc-binding dehydrogenase [Actinomycetota bacterium]
MASEVAAVLMCAGIAVYPPLRRHAAEGLAKIGVVGIGGLGHLAIQFAHALGCEVTALSSSPEKEEEARAFGADHFILSTDPMAMGNAEYYFDMLLCTSPGGNDWPTLLMALKKNGSVVLPAFSPVNLDISTDSPASGAAVDLVVHQLSITGSFLGNRTDMTDMIEFAYQHGVAPQIELMPMNRANEAIDRVRMNAARYRTVLVNE